MTSIQRRLTLGLGAVCCLLWSAGGIALYLILRAGLLSEFDEALGANAQTLSLQTEQSKTQFKFDPAGELMPSFERAERADYFQIWLPDGSTLARSTSLREANLPRRAGTPNAPRFWNLTLPDGLPGRAIGTHFLPPVDDEAPPQTRSEVTLVVARDRTALDRRLNWLATTLLLVGAAMAAAMVLVVAFVVRRGLWPLSGLAERAATIDASSLQLRFPTDNLPAELLPISQRLNDLLTRLEASFARERRFSADVAHELRTPIAELRALAEVALKWPDDATETRRGWNDARAIALQMESIATSLLTLARCEAGLQPITRAAVCVAAVLREVWQPLADRARERELSVSFDVTDEVRCEGDPSLFRLILANLLSNAVEYCPPGGSVHCRAAASDGRWQMTVSNTTNSLTADDLLHLFERFWRKDPARASNANSGLGLALAKALAESMDMEIRAALSGPATLAITLSARSPRP